MLRHPSVPAHALAAFIPAGLFFLFDNPFLHNSSAGAWYNLTLDMNNAVMSYGKFGFALVGVACIAGLVDALLIDALLSTICAAVFAVCGVEWSRQGYSDGYLRLLFAVVFFVAARGIFRDWRRIRREATAGTPINKLYAPPTEPHPASVHPESLPMADQPPPAEGYLAALAREKREAPRADIE